MTAYKDICQINRIIDSAPENFDFYVHVDKKSNLKTEDISSRAHIFSEYRIYWGAVEHLKAFLFLMEKAYTSGKQYDFYHLITGQDFYACPFDKFDNLLEFGKNYIETWRFPRKNWWHDGYGIIKYKTLASKVDLRKKRYKLANMAYYWWQRLTKTYHSIPNYPMAGGSVYCTISGGAVNYILYSEISKDLLKRLMNTTCAEELFFQTVLINSPYKNSIVNDNLRYIDWSVHTPPKYLTVEDYDKICQSEKLFCRKIDSSLSKDLITNLQLLIKGQK